MSMSKRPTDAYIAKLLCQLPLHLSWNDITLPGDVLRTLNEADEQRLMCIVAYSLQRLMDEGRDATAEPRLSA